MPIYCIQKVGIAFFFVLNKHVENLPMSFPSPNTTTITTCGTTANAASQTYSFVNPLFTDRDHFPKTGVEDLCEDYYKKICSNAYEKIEKMEDVIKSMRVNNQQEYLGMVRRLAEEYESRLSTERMKQFKLQDEIEQLNFKYRKLSLDYEKLKILLQANLNP